MCKPRQRHGSATRILLMILAVVAIIPFGMILLWRASSTQTRTIQFQDATLVEEAHVPQLAELIPVQNPYPAFGNSANQDRPRVETEYVQVTNSATGAIEYQPAQRVVTGFVPQQYANTGAFSVPPFLQPSAELDPRVNELIIRIRTLAVQSEPREQAEGELKELLSTEFDEMHANQQRSIDQTERRLESLKRIHDKRLENKGQIVDRRAALLLGEPDELGWEPNPPTQTYRDDVRQLNPTRTPVNAPRNPASASQLLPSSPTGSWRSPPASLPSSSPYAPTDLQDPAINLPTPDLTLPQSAAQISPRNPIVVTSSDRNPSASQRLPPIPVNSDDPDVQRDSNPDWSPLSMDTDPGDPSRIDVGIETDATSTNPQARIPGYDGRSMEHGELYTFIISSIFDSAGRISRGQRSLRSYQERLDSLPSNSTANSDLELRISSFKKTLIADKEKAKSFWKFLDSQIKALEANYESSKLVVDQMLLNASTDEASEQVVKARAEMERLRHDLQAAMAHRERVTRMTSEKSGENRSEWAELIPAIEY